MVWFAGILLFPLFALAQQDSLITTEKVKPSIKVGLFGVSRLNYYGRTDSLKSSGFFPVLEVWGNNHLYVSAAPVFINNSTVSSVYGGTVIAAGYMFRNKKWVGNNYFSVPLYRPNSGLVQERLKFQATAGISRITKIITINTSADLKYSGEIDYSVSAGLDHLFRFQTPKGLVIALDPSVYLNAGTQHYTRTSFKQSGFPLLPPVQQSVEEKVRRFSILSCEFSMPVVMAKGRFQFILNPAYSIPQNIITVAGKPDLSELGQNMVYVTAGIKWKVY